MAAVDYALDEEEDMAIDMGIGYPRAFAKLCRDHVGVGIYSHGPPFTFTPFPLCQDENSIAKQLDQMFPIIDPQAKPTEKPKIFVSLLWKRLNHLGNAGFDPAVVRVDPYGNVLYFHADKASPLAWDIDHWFPCSRGGLTVPSNLRILQWQVCRRKHNKLEFLIPWWDFQLGISVNQFLSIFASSNSDFRHRGFQFLFSEGENEEIHDSQTVESHSFPQHFHESKEQEGLAPAAIVVCRREPYDSSLALRSVDYNRQMTLHSPAIAARKGKPGEFKENDNPDFNPYRAIIMARDSLKQKEAQKMQAEIQKLGDEVQEISRKNEEEKLVIQDLELQLIKRRRRAEKCRRLAEAQSSYRTMLEKMIRDAMHQSVIYKEQVRLNQAATSALMARLEAQRAICDAAEKELHKKFKQRDELETQLRPEWEQGRKRSRTDHNHARTEDRDNKSVLYLPSIRPRTPLHKELRVYLEEEHIASKVSSPANAIECKSVNSVEELKKPAKNNLKEEEESNGPKTKATDAEHEIPLEHKLQELEIEEGKSHKFQFSINREPEIEEEDEESRKERGKGNVERWLQMLLENSEENIEPGNYNNDNENCQTHDIITRLNEQFPQIPIKGSSKHSIIDIKEDITSTSVVHKEKQEHIDQSKDKGKKPVEEIAEMEENNSAMEKRLLSMSEIVVGSHGIGSSSNRSEATERKDQKKGLTRSESARILRRIPSSPLILGMKKGVECMRRKKPLVTGDEDSDENHVPDKRLIKSSIKTIKRVVKI